MKRKSPLLLVVLTAAALILPSAARGQDEDDGPGLGVARVSLVNGDVTVRRGDSGDWIQAEVNMPLVEGDSIATGRASRAEVQLNYANLLRLNEESEMNVAQLANRSFRVQVAQGVVTYSELKGGEADVDIETPLAAVRPREKGMYRVEVFGQDRVIVTVREGEAHIASTESIETLKEGRTMVIRGEGERVEFQTARAESKDDWDRWNERRDDQLRKSESYQYVSRSISGAQDLDDHGHWTYVSGYGRCWFPSVAAGWAPYRDGRWVWLDYYGWSWVGYEPWGWAPYHYGRWFHHAGYGWGWYPGPYYAPYRWRPALVSFFGIGFGSGGFSFGVGFGRGYGGNIGWVPLAPGERFYPWYGPRFRNGHRGNTTIIVDNSVNIVNNYRNARQRGGVTVVDGNDFGRGGNFNRNRDLPEADLRRASVMRGQIPIVPDRENQGRVVRASNSGPQSMDRGGVRGGRFFSTSPASQTPNRTSFEQQREQLSSSIRSFGEGRGARNTASNGSPTASVDTGRSSFRGRAGTAAPAAAAAEPDTATVGGRGSFSASRDRSGVRGGFPSASAEAAGSAGAPSSAAAAESAGRADTGWRTFGRRSTPANSSPADAGTPGNSESRTFGQSRGAAIDRSGSNGASDGISNGSRSRDTGGFSRSESRRFDPGPARSSGDAQVGSTDRGNARIQSAPRSSGNSESSGSRTFSTPRQASPPRESSSPRQAAPASPSRDSGSGSRGGRQRFAPRTSSRIQSGSDSSRAVASVLSSDARASRGESSSRTFSNGTSSRAGIFGESRGSDRVFATSPQRATSGSARGGFEASRSSRISTQDRFSGRSAPSRAPAVSQPSTSASRNRSFGSLNRGAQSSGSSGSGGFSRGGASRGGGSVSRGGGGGSVSRGGGSGRSGGSSRGSSGGGGRGFGGRR